MAVTTFEVDAGTAELIASLRGTFDVKSNAAVIRKALALANVVPRASAIAGWRTGAAFQPFTAISAASLLDKPAIARDPNRPVSKT